MNGIYLDHNATTPLLPAVWEAMRPFVTETFGNPASAHWAGRRARQALEDARERIAVLLGADPDEVVFTSGATEANNLAIFGLTGAPPGRVLTSRIEHASVAEPVGRLRERGFVVDHLPVSPEGTIRLEAAEKMFHTETRLLCVMLVNHETGAIQPVAELAELLRAFGRNDSSSEPEALATVRPRPSLTLPARTEDTTSGQGALHCDAAQAVGRVSVDFHRLGASTLSLSAHKFHGPKGIGVLLVRRGTKLAPLTLGGHQQQGRRPGTEPVALAVGLATALDLAHREAESRRAHVINLRRRFLERLHEEAAPVVLNGPTTGGVPHTVNLSFPGCQADVLLMNLDLAGVACSTGSACSSGSLLPSPVLQAMGVSDEVLHGAMRFSLSALLSEADVDEAARRIADVVVRLRQLRDEENP
jgi:cysteine desulfurase